MAGLCAIRVKQSRRVTAAIPPWAHAGSGWGAEISIRQDDSFTRLALPFAQHRARCASDSGGRQRLRGQGGPGHATAVLVRVRASAWHVSDSHGNQGFSAISRPDASPRAAVARRSWHRPCVRRGNDVRPFHTPRPDMPRSETNLHAEPTHDWLRLLGDQQGPELERSLLRLARLAAAAHRAQAADAWTAPRSRGHGWIGKLHAKLRPHRREDDSRDHGRSRAAVDPRPRGGSEAKECDR